MKSKPTSLFYVLKGKRQVPATLTQWAIWFGTSWPDRQVSETILTNKRKSTIRISTVFLGLDHNFSNFMPNRPLLFESMVFGGKNSGHTNRYHTWKEAAIGHQKIVAMVKAENKSYQ